MMGYDIEGNRLPMTLRERLRAAWVVLFWRAPIEDVTVSWIHREGPLRGQRASRIAVGVRR